MVSFETPVDIHQIYRVDLYIMGTWIMHWKTSLQLEGITLMYTRSFKVPWGYWIDVHSHIMPQGDVALSQLCDMKNTEDDIIWNFKSYGSSEHLIMQVSQPQMPSWTNFKEANSWQKVFAFFLSIHPSLSVVAAGESSLLLRLGDPETFPGQMGYVIPLVCTGLVQKGLFS